MSWRGLRYKARERLLSREWNAVVDALNDLYGFLTTGTQDIYVDEVYGRTAHFTERIDCEGKPVILDGDPISIYQFYDIAKSQITEAIDVSKAKATLDAIYGKLLTKEDVTTAIDNAKITSINALYGDLISQYTRRSAEANEALLPKVDLLTDYVRETRDVVVRLKMDEYGNVGIIIAEPLDEYGRVKTAPPSELLDEFKPVSASGSISATDNTAGFSVTLNKGGRPNVNVYYSLGGAGTVYLKVSVDGVAWRTLKTYTLDSAGEGVDIIQGVAYQYVKLETPTTGIDVEFEIVASR
jgi:hypothetical protein